MSKIHIYHHNDHDGIVSAGVLYNFLLDRDVYRTEDISFYMIDYNKLLNFDHINFEKLDQVYFLDYSFSNKYNIAQLEKLLNRRLRKDDVVWIDHHLSSMDLFNNYDIEGVRNTSLCGAAWTYVYCHGWIGQYDDITKERNISTSFHNDPKIPMFLKYIDDYDCWKKLYKHTNDFHYGLTISDPTDETISRLLVTDDGIIGAIENVAFKGKDIQEYLNFENKEYHINMYGFEYVLPEEHGGLRCFCINRKGNSLMFGDKIKEYDAVIPFYFNNGKWTYSIYTNKDEINCEEVAKSYGGGGHKGAAGWVGDFIFVEV